jgi:hypothetical protein
MAAVGTILFLVAFGFALRDLLTKERLVTMLVFVLCYFGTWIIATSENLGKLADADHVLRPGVRYITQSCERNTPSLKPEALIRVPVGDGMMDTYAVRFYGDCPPPEFIMLNDSVVDVARK